MQSLSYAGPSRNKLSNNLKTNTSVNCFKHDMKKYFLKKLSGTEAGIYIYIYSYKKTLRIRALSV